MSKRLEEELTQHRISLLKTVALDQWQQTNKAAQNLKSMGNAALAQHQARYRQLHQRILRAIGGNFGYINIALDAADVVALVEDALDITDEVCSALGKMIEQQTPTDVLLMQAYLRKKHKFGHYDSTQVLNAFYQNQVVVDGRLDFSAYNKESTDSAIDQIDFREYQSKKTHIKDSVTTITNIALVEAEYQTVVEEVKKEVTAVITNAVIRILHEGSAIVAGYLAKYTSSIVDDIVNDNKKDKKQEAKSAGTKRSKKEQKIADICKNDDLLDEYKNLPLKEKKQVDKALEQVLDLENTSQELANTQVDSKKLALLHGKLSAASDKASEYMQKYSNYEDKHPIKAKALLVSSIILAKGVLGFVTAGPAGILAGLGKGVFDEVRSQATNLLIGKQIEQLMQMGIDQIAPYLVKLDPTLTDQQTKVLAGILAASMLSANEFKAFAKGFAKVDVCRMRMHKHVFRSNDGARPGSKPYMNEFSEGSGKTRKFNVPKAKSHIWNELKPYRGDIKTNGLKGKDKRYYQWDHTHNDIEVFDHKWRHVGSKDPTNGQMYKTGKGHSPSFKN